MVFTKGNKFGGKRKDKEDSIKLAVDEALKNQKNSKYKCKGCGKSLDSNPIAHLIDFCYDCVKKKQPDGEFQNYFFISGTSVKKIKQNENKEL